MMIAENEVFFVTFFALILHAYASLHCFSNQTTTYLCRGQCMLTAGPNVKFSNIEEERNSLTKIDDKFLINHILSADGSFAETEACTTIPNLTSSNLHLSCITTYRNDAAKYGVLEDYVFEEDCIGFTKVVRAYVDKENPENFSKFQVCSLTCLLDEN